MVLYTLVNIEFDYAIELKENSHSKTLKTKCRAYSKMHQKYWMILTHFHTSGNTKKRKMQSTSSVTNKAILFLNCTNKQQHIHLCFLNLFQILWKLKD